MCCQKGKMTFAALPPLPGRIRDIFLDPSFQRASRSYNNTFCLSALCVSGEFVHLQEPACVKIQGRTYHVVLPTDKAPAAWYVSDADYSERQAAAKRDPKLGMQASTVMTIAQVLERVNPLVRQYKKLADRSVEVTLRLEWNPMNADIAAVIESRPTTDITNPRALYVERVSRGKGLEGQHILRFDSALYEPL